MLGPDSLFGVTNARHQLILWRAKSQRHSVVYGALLPELHRRSVNHSGRALRRLDDVAALHPGEE